MNGIGIALIWCIVQVTLLAVVSSLLYGLARRSGPPARALAAFAGLILIVGLTALAFSPWPSWQAQARQLAADKSKLPADGRGSADGGTKDRRGNADEPPDDDADQIGKSANVSDSPTPAAVFIETLFSEIQRLPASAESETWGWPANLAVLFLIGSGIGLVRLVAGLAAVRSYRLCARPVADASLQELADVLLAELGGPRAVVLCESELLSTPATIGWRRPLIILPVDWKTWTIEERRAVLAHEIAHIARHDFPTWVAAQGALVFHFYHPLVHWLAARLRLEQELAADATAARLTGGQRSYLTTLAGMALRQSEHPLAWPARTFLPTRGTFMRRIEMLRDERQLSAKMSAGVRIGMTVILFSAGLAVAGLRGAAADRESASDSGAPAKRQTALLDDTQAKGAARASDGKQGPFSLAYVPRDAVVVAACRPAELLSRPAFAAAKKTLLDKSGLEQVLGVGPDRMEEVTAVIFMGQGPNGSPLLTPAGTIVRLSNATDAAAFLKAVQPDSDQQEYGGQTYFRTKDGRASCSFLADERTVVASGREDYLRRLIVAGKSGASKAKWSETWKSAATSDAAVLINSAGMKDAIEGELSHIPEGHAKFGMFAPLWQGTSSALLSANLREKLTVTLELSAVGAKDAQRVKDTLAAVLTLGQNSLSQVREMVSRQPGGEGAMLLGSIDIADSLLDSVKIDLADSRVRAAATLDAEDAASMIALLLPAVSNAREAARRAQSTNNLKQLALAMHNYADANHSFPPAVLFGPDGKTPYSWRVALLPYLEQGPLYEQYKKDETWDSANNKQVLAKMPAVFRDPNDPADSTFSSYYAITGPSTVFFGKEGVKFSQIFDGTSNTIMFVEANRDIPWTKPEDIPYTADKVPVKIPPGKDGVAAVGSAYATDKPLPKLGGRYNGIFLAALCDGSVHAIPQSIDPMTLRAMLTRDGGEAIQWPAVLQGPSRFPPGTPPARLPPGLIAPPGGKGLRR